MTEQTVSDDHKPVPPWTARRFCPPAVDKGERRREPASRWPSSLGDLAGRATVTVPEAASALGISDKVGYELVRAGELPSLRLGRAAHRARLPHRCSRCWALNKPTNRKGNPPWTTTSSGLRPEPSRLPMSSTVAIARRSRTGRCCWGLTSTWPWGRTSGCVLTWPRRTTPVPGWTPLVLAKARQDMADAARVMHGYKLLEIQAEHDCTMWEAELIFAGSRHPLKGDDD